MKISEMFLSDLQELETQIQARKKEIATLSPIAQWAMGWTRGQQRGIIIDRTPGRCAIRAPRHAFITGYVQFAAGTPIHQRLFPNKSNILNYLDSI